MLAAARIRRLDAPAPLRIREATIKIAIIGAGSVGSALARGWARKGHNLLLGVRDPSDRAVQSLCQDTRA